MTRLNTWPTSNGRKALTMLKAIDLLYVVHTVETEAMP